MEGIKTFRVRITYEWQTCCYGNTTKDEYLVHGGTAGDIERATTEAYRNMWLSEEETVNVKVEEVRP